MTTKNNEKPIVIGVGGFARSGKDTFVKIAKNILKDNGYSSVKLAFADPLKEEIDPFLRKHYDISAWTDDTDEKTIIRPYLVAHGCGKRKISEGRYWVNQIDGLIETVHFGEDVIFVSDCRFPNEVDWVHNKWGGWFVHLKKYSIRDYEMGGLYKEPRSVKNKKVYDEAPNEEEAIQDPLCVEKSDYRLELENSIEKTLREKGIKITADALVDDSYLINEITLCLSKCPFLTILRP
jgi:hypothetical protein